MRAVGIEPVRRRRITAEKVAIATVMAGCLPEYLPVVVACVKAMCEPEFGLHGVTASTGGSAPFVVVNGPIRQRLGMNATHNVLGNGSRPNATIGRALRLLIINVLGGIPGQLDRSTLGHPGKFTFCLAEDEEDSPWLPLAAERGIPAGASAVTVLAVESPHQVMNEWTHDPAGYRRDLRRGHPRQHAHVLDLGRELRAGGAQAAPAGLRRGRVEQERPARVRARARPRDAP